jgi:hypothetical protein
MFAKKDDTNPTLHNNKNQKQTIMYLNISHL